MPHRRWSAWWLLPAVCGLVGCAGDNRGGGMAGPPPPPGTSAMAPSPGGSRDLGSSTSPAALAQAPSSLDMRDELRGGSTPAAATGNSGLKPPEPPRPVFAAAPPRSYPVSRGVAPAGGTYVATYEQAQAFLKARGVKWQRLETWGDEGEWKFTCSIPNRANAFISRTYEARADTDLAAVRAVLEQVEKER